MLTTWVMTVIGVDRPGLVSRLAALITEHGGNWLESRMARLGGRFAGIVRIEFPADQETRLRAALHSLEAEGLSVQAYADGPAASPAARTLATIEVIGHDRPGIVREISQVLAQHHVNVEELVTHCESAPMAGNPMFKATAKVGVPESCELADLRHALEQIATDLMVDVELRASDSPR